MKREPLIVDTGAHAGDTVRLPDGSLAAICYFEHGSLCPSYVVVEPLGSSLRKQVPVDGVRLFNKGRGWEKMEPRKKR